MLRPQSAKYPSTIRQAEQRPPMPFVRQANNFVDGEDPYSQHQNGGVRSNSQKGGLLLRPQSGYQQTQNILMKLNNLPTEKSKQNFQHSHQEVEKLQEDLRQLKLKVNELREENTKVKTKNMILEKDKQKYERAIQDIQMHGVNNNRLISKLGQDANMVFTMKQSIKELRTGLDQKEDEIYKIKKAVKYTKIQEVEMEKKAYADESLRLRGIIEQLLEYRQEQEMGSLQIGKMQNQIIEQNNMLNQMQESNNELAQTAQELEFQNNQMQQLLEKKPDNKKAEMQIQSLRHEVSLRDQEINKLKHQVQLLESRDSKQKIQRPQSGNASNNQQQQQSNQITYLKQELLNREQENEQLRQDMAEIEFYLQTNGLIKSQASSIHQPSEPIQRPKSHSDVRQAPAFMSNSYQQEARNPQMDQEDGFTKQKKQSGIRKPNNFKDIETSQLSSNNREVDLDQMEYQKTEEAYKDNFEEIVDEDAYSRLDQAEEDQQEEQQEEIFENYDDEKFEDLDNHYEQSNHRSSRKPSEVQFQYEESEKEEVYSSHHVPKSLSVVGRKDQSYSKDYSKQDQSMRKQTSDYQMDLDSVRVNEYLSKEGHYQQSMSLQHEDIDSDGISDGPVHY